MMRFSHAVLLAVLGYAYSLSATAADKALLIGIGEYQAGAQWALPGTQNDLDAMQKLLMEGFSMPPAAIKVLRNKDATHQNILNTIDDWLIEGTNKGDRIFLYYSGHGSFIPDLDGDESIEAGGDGYDETLVAYDVTCTAGNGCVNMVTDDEIGERLEKLADRYVISMFDSCHSGTVTRSINADSSIKTRLFQPDMATQALRPDVQTSQGEQATPQATTRSMAKAHKLESGFVDPSSQHVNLFAVQPFQEALEIRSSGGSPSGLFTSQVVRALLGREGDFNADGFVSFGELKRYTTEKSAMFCESNGRQCSNGLNPLVEVSPELLGSEVITFGKKSDLASDENLDNQQISAILSHGNEANLQVQIQPGDQLGVGDRMRIQVTSDRGGLLLLFDKGADGQLVRLYPNDASSRTRPDGRPLGWIRAESDVLIPDSLADWEYVVEEPLGKGVLIAVLAESYQESPPLNEAFEPVVQQEKSLGELRVSLDELIDSLDDETLRESPKWSMTLANYEVVPR